jgi:hypothetical protein
MLHSNGSTFAASSSWRSGKGTFAWKSGALAGIMNAFGQPWLQRLILKYMDTPDD